MTRFICLLVALLTLALPLAGCGRKGVPHPPGPPDRIIYPKSYPTE